MTTSIPVLQPHATSKPCVGIFEGHPYGAETIYDTGIRFYLTGPNGDIDIWAPDSDTDAYAESLLNQLFNTSCIDMTGEEFLDWCENKANKSHALGVSRMFYTPTYARESLQLDPLTRHITEEAKSQGM
jgi:hypothetical protein